MGCTDTKSFDAIYPNTLRTNGRATPDHYSEP